MPLTDKGRKILKKMQEEYGAKKGKEVFYASANKGTIKDVHVKNSEFDAAIDLLAALIKGAADSNYKIKPNYTDVDTEATDIPGIKNPNTGKPVKTLKNETREVPLDIDTCTDSRGAINTMSEEIGKAIKTSSREKVITDMHDLIITSIKDAFVDMGKEELARGNIKLAKLYAISAVNILKHK